MDFIRMLGLKMSGNGTCNKCGNPRDKGDHSKCDRWPTSHGISKGFHYVANSRETTLTELKNITKALCSGEADNTPVRFEIRILQTRNVEQLK